jgi:putative hydrolase of the HAD superfamily
MALDSLKIKACDAIMVGDWPERDVEGAKKVGMRTIFARYGDTFDTKHSGADWDVNDIYEIVGIIKELNGA